MLQQPQETNRLWESIARTPELISERGWEKVRKDFPEKAKLELEI